MNPTLDRLTRGPAFRLGNLLDLRSVAEFGDGHLRGSASMPLEVELASVPEAVRSAWLADRLPSIFLPPRHEPLGVVAADGELAAVVARDLAARGRTEVESAALGPGDLTDVPAIMLGHGMSHHRLWRPPPFLERWAHLLPPPAAGPVLDLACGSGRATVWLAEQGWRVTGVDHQPEALDLARRLAAESRVHPILLNRDLRRPENLPTGPWAAVLLFRYLDRALLGRLPAVLQDRAVVMLRTFRDAPGYIGNPQPRHRLARNEALSLLPVETEILVHEESFDGDGRPAAGTVHRCRPLT